MQDRLYISPDAAAQIREGLARQEAEPRNDQPRTVRSPRLSVEILIAKVTGAAICSPTRYYPGMLQIYNRDTEVWDDLDAIGYLFAPNNESLVLNRRYLTKIVGVTKQTTACGSITEGIPILLVTGTIVGIGGYTGSKNIVMATSCVGGALSVTTEVFTWDSGLLVSVV